MEGPTKEDLEKIKKGENPEKFEVPELDEVETARKMCWVKRTVKQGGK